MSPNLDPWTPQDRAWAGGYRAGFYPDDFEPCPDVLDGMEHWIEGYLTGCACREKMQKRYGAHAVVRLHAKRQRENPLVQRVIMQHLPKGVEADVDNAENGGMLTT